MLEPQWVGLVRGVMARRLPEWKMPEDEVDALLRHTIAEFSRPTEEHGGMWTATGWIRAMEAKPDLVVPVLLASVRRLRDSLAPQSGAGGAGSLLITRGDVFDVRDDFDQFVAAMVWGDRKPGTGGTGRLRR
jgi:hypothetical protein